MCVAGIYTRIARRVHGEESDYHKVLIVWVIFHNGFDSYWRWFNGDVGFSLLTNSNSIQALHVQGFREPGGTPLNFNII